MSEELDDITAHQRELVQAWVREHGRRGVPVLVGPAPRPEEFEEGEEFVDDRDVEFTHEAPWLAGNPGDAGRLAMVRLGWNWRTVQLDTLEVHPRHAELAAFKAPECVDLEFPPPDCAYCEIGLDHDGDGWACGQCRASWASNGYSGHTRVCVEPDCGGFEADTVGEDGQPRCGTCQFLVMVGRIEPTSPYKCKESVCGDKVTGMPAETSAARNRRCGRHQQQVESDAYWKDYLAARPVLTAAPL
jgi:hypothetical protein